MATYSGNDPNKMAMKCEDCNVIMVGIIPYQQHLSGKQHKRAVELARNRTMALARNRETIQVITTTMAFQPRGGDEFYCKICKKSMTGPEPYKQHIESAKHIKAAETVAFHAPKTTVTVTEKITRMDFTDAANDEADDFYQNKYLQNVTIVEGNESVADALFKIGYI